MVIDFHVHAFTDALAERAIGALKNTARVVNHTDGTVADTVKKLEEWGVDKGVLLPIATKPKQQRIINDWAASLNQPRLIPFGTIHPDCEDKLQELERLKSLGFKGIKLHPDYQNVMVDDPRLLPVYDLCSQLGLIVVIHAGFDPVSPELVHAPPVRSAAIIEQFPNLKFVLAHMGGTYMWDEAEEYLVGKNVFLDTAFCAGELPVEQITRMIEKHGAERVLMASDCPWHASISEVQMIESLPLTAYQKERIFYGNAKELLGL